MNIRLILLLSLAGIAVGLLSITGVVHAGFEFILWIVLSIVIASILSRATPQRPFLHGFLTGFIAGLLCSLVQILFFDAYLSANPYSAKTLTQLPAGVSPRVAVAILSPISAAITGLFIGLFSWLAVKILSRSNAASSAPPV